MLLFIVSLCENRVSIISITASAEREREREAYELRALLVGALVLRVDAREVGDDDGHRERNDEHTAQRAHAARDLPHQRLRHHVCIVHVYERADATLRIGTVVLSS